jgi:hypothetical protein
MDFPASHVADSRFGCVVNNPQKDRTVNSQNSDPMAMVVHQLNSARICEEHFASSS